MNVEQVASSSDEMMRQLTVFIAEKVLNGKCQEISADTPLVSSGLIDSMALIDVYHELERVAGRKIPASKVQAKHMNTVRLMFAMAERFGKPVKS